MAEDSQESSMLADESTFPSRRRKIYNLTNHQVIGTLVATVLIGALGWVVGAFGWMGSAIGGAGGMDGYDQTFAGHLTLQHTVYKDIDTEVPTNAHGPGGDVRYTWGYATLGGVKIAPYRGSGAPTADKCDQAARVNGDASQGVRTQGWYCIRSAKGSVAALRVDTIGNDAIDGYAIVWHP